LASRTGRDLPAGADRPRDRLFPPFVKQEAARSFLRRSSSFPPRATGIGKAGRRSLGKPERQVSGRQVRATSAPSPSLRLAALASQRTAGARHFCAERPKPSSPVRARRRNRMPYRAWPCRSPVLPRAAGLLQGVPQFRQGCRDIQGCRGRQGSFLFQKLPWR
jgi:hypothetical protein